MYLFLSTWQLLGEIKPTQYSKPKHFQAWKLTHLVVPRTCFGYTRQATSYWKDVKGPLQFRENLRPGEALE